VSQEQILSWERELLGIYVSNHPARVFHENLSKYLTLSDALADKEKDTQIKVAGVIVAIKKILTKQKQEPMVFLRVEDARGPIEVVVFPKIYRKINEWLVEGKMVLIDGKVSIRKYDNQDEYSVLADNIVQFAQKDIDEIVTAFEQGVFWNGTEELANRDDFDYQNGVFISIPQSPDHKLIVDLRNILKEHPGRDMVYLVVESGGKNRKVSTEYSVTKNRSLMEDIIKIVGVGNVR
jgi:DNA polymerase-3 subunit alpha